MSVFIVHHRYCISFTGSVTVQMFLKGSLDNCVFSYLNEVLSKTKEQAEEPLRVLTFIKSVGKGTCCSLLARSVKEY